MEFLVKVNDGREKAELVFGTEEEALLLDKWREVVVGAENQQVHDAKEFATLAAKRWRYYSGEKLSVTSLGELQGAIKSNSDGEYAFILLANAKWPRDIRTLGMCYCRRTWTNHLVIDFLAVHPDVIGAVPERVNGVGSGMLRGVARLASELQAKRIWGEATSGSAGFYSTILGRSVLDTFIIEGDELEKLRLEFQRLRPPDSVIQTEPEPKP